MDVRRPALSLLLACALLVAPVAGCGSSGTSTSSTTPAETAQRLPKLPAGWRPHANPAIGYAIGLAPGWKARDVHGQVSLIRSPDHLVSVRLTADRTPEALDVPVTEFASQALESLPGYGRLPAGRARRVRGTPLQAGEADAVAVAKSNGVRTELRVVVLRRPELVNYTAVVSANAAQAPPAEVALALRMLGTLRDRPVTNAVGPESL
jgi:hypothetical protein